MNIIIPHMLNYNISVDGGDYISNIIFMKNTIIPATSKISFVIPEADMDYNISIVMGDNILSSDNILLHKTTINMEIINNKNIKVLYMTITLLPSYIMLSIDIKNAEFYKALFPYYTDNIITQIKDIDITMYRLQFELKQIIMIINKKISKGSLMLDIDTENILKDKLIRLEGNISNMTNAKMLEIKNSLKIKFFID
jgi:hypothetical protein